MLALLGRSREVFKMTETQRSAGSVIHDRFAVVARDLQEVADNGLSEESQHDLRIACRRAEAAIWLCRDVGGLRSWRWLRGKLKSLREACNSSRDDDVLRSWLKRSSLDVPRSLHRELKARQKRARPAIVKLSTQLSASRRFQQVAKGIVKHLAEMGHGVELASNFSHRLFEQLDRFVIALPTNHNDLAALHSMRVMTKRFRYSSEIVSEIWPQLDLVELRELLQSVQKRAGTIHDLDVGRRRLSKLIAGHKKQSARQLLRAMSDEGLKEQREFWSWWISLPIEQTLANTTVQLLRFLRS